MKNVKKITLLEILFIVIICIAGLIYFAVPEQYIRYCQAINFLNALYH